MSLSWEYTYEIVLELKQHYADIDVDAVGTQQLLQMILALPDFNDDPALANEDLLNDILREWYEESTNEWN
jgi:FeS assembly protein IscX